MKPEALNPQNVSSQVVKLSALAPFTLAVVIDVHDAYAGDMIARRLRELGFVADEPVKIVGRGPIGGEPLLVQIGFTRFALRSTEAARIDVAVDIAVDVAIGVDQSGLS